MSKRSQSLQGDIHQRETELFPELWFELATLYCDCRKKSDTANLQKEPTLDSRQKELTLDSAP